MKAIMNTENKKLQTWLGNDTDRKPEILIDSEYLADERGDDALFSISENELLEMMEKVFNSSSSSSISGWLESGEIITGNNYSLSISDLHEIYGDDFAQVSDNVVRFER